MRVAVDPILLACCAVEVATALRTLPAPQGIEVVDTDPEVTVVIIAGTITAATAEFVQQRIDGVRGPRAVIAYGVCASSGGPYWDSHAVLQGWPEADRFVPGCPPPAAVLWGAIETVAREVVSHAAR